MKTTHIVYCEDHEVGYQIAKTYDNKWSYRKTTGSQDQRGLSFEQIKQLPGHWQGIYNTKKEDIASITNDGEHPIEKW